MSPYLILFFQRHPRVYSVYLRTIVVLTIVLLPFFIAYEVAKAFLKKLWDCLRDLPGLFRWLWAVVKHGEKAL